MLGGEPRAFPTLQETLTDPDLGKFGFAKTPAASQDLVAMRLQGPVSPDLSGMHFSQRVWDGRIGVRVYIGNKIASKALPQLEADRAAIESEIGAPLQWNPNPDNIDKVILLDRDADLDDRDKWPEYLAWLADQVGKFKRAFEPRVKKLVLSQGDGSDTEDFVSN
jgi:hypothetical protein